MSQNKTSSNSNPYMDARAEWVERYGSYISQKRNWQIIALISMVITLISVVYVGYMGTQNKLVPYVIEVDKLGNTNKIGMVSKEIDIKNPNVIKHSLNSFIFSWRTVWGNDASQRKFILDAYSYLKPKTKTYNIVNEYFEKNNPFDRSKKENIRVKVISIVPQNIDTWQVEWEETTTTTTGEEMVTDIYRGFFTIEQIIPQTEEQILKNPLGIFIVDLNFAKVIK